MNIKFISHFLCDPLGVANYDILRFLKFRRVTTNIL